MPHEADLRIKHHEIPSPDNIPVKLDYLPCPYRQWTEAYIGVLKRDGYEIRGAEIRYFAKCILDLLESGTESQGAHLLFGTACFALLNKGELLNKRPGIPGSWVSEERILRNWDKQFGLYIAGFLYYNCTKRFYRLWKCITFERCKILHHFEHGSRRSYRARHQLLPNFLE